ncbi:EAL domain-containing protein [Polycladidibacter stylochi]|uniref:GGDEF/EAL-containing response regulator n=1 Tax=Polycladidibacter stylochi TaxID=1807766 RepID=UPI00082F922E|nr:EAL domain-containing protein [Pseudovibrio stylochi]
MSLIVVIDDRAINRAILNKLALSVEDGIETHCFASPVKALQFMQEVTPDLVVSDYSMPEMDGAEVAKSIREISGCLHVPIIVITAFSDQTFRMRALEAGATDFIQSPLDHNEFLRRARNHLMCYKLKKQHKAYSTQITGNLAETSPFMFEGNVEQMLQILDSVPSMITAIDRDNNSVFVNNAFARFVGKSKSEIIGRNLYSLLAFGGVRTHQLLNEKVFKTGSALPPFEMELRLPNGGNGHFWVSKQPLVNQSGQTTHVVTTATDITDRKRVESHLLHIAHHDSLTDLPNRALLSERIDAEIQSCRRNGSFFALHFLDLDRFKSINDALGHRAGDRLLEVIAERLKRCIGENDLVARLGGDEFAILQANLTSSESALVLANEVVDLITEPFSLEGQQLHIGTSIGITCYPDDGLSSDELLRHADLAMYQSKAEGGNTFRLFSQTMGRKARENMALEAELRQALHCNQFQLYFQPQVNLKTRQIIGAEALLRWKRPGHGIVSPQVFLAMAEETGLIMEIGEWVLFEACRQAHKWHQAGLDHLHVAVNFSPSQFRKQNIPSLVEAALHASNLPAEALEIEITEQIVMHGADTIAPSLLEIQGLGARILIDDFGTGYSSLAYLSKLPIDGLKIDHCFVSDLLRDKNNEVIAKAIISLGQSLGLTVLAEGIEEPEQAAWLRQAGCTNGQGYYFGRPMSADDFFLQVIQNGQVFA